MENDGTVHGPFSVHGLAWPARSRGQRGPWPTQALGRAGAHAARGHGHRGGGAHDDEPADEVLRPGRHEHE
jgi:hypothetical protein